MSEYTEVEQPFLQQLKTLGRISPLPRPTVSVPTFVEKRHVSKVCGVKLTRSR